MVATPLHTTGTIDVAIEFYCIVELEYCEICCYNISRLPLFVTFWISFLGCYYDYINDSLFSIICLFLNSREPYLLFTLFPSPPGLLLSED